MSAGDGREHYVQDAAEAYLVWRLQESALDHRVSLTGDAHRQKESFRQYVDARGVAPAFERSAYKANVDSAVEGILLELEAQYPGERFEFTDVEKLFRDKKMKGDFLIDFSTRPAVSVSVKNYKHGFERIQLCSGTWNSFLNNFLFQPLGVGMFMDPETGERFKGSDRVIRDRHVRKMAMEPLLDAYAYFDQVNTEIKTFYVYDGAAEWWSSIEQRWRTDCAQYGRAAARVVTQALRQLSPETVKARLLSMSGLNYDEEILLLGKGDFLSSLSSHAYKKLLVAANEESTQVRFEPVGQTLRFELVDALGNVVAPIDVPFTLQKNGAWNLPNVPYSGTRWLEKEQAYLAYGQRRPRKSKELATSTNTYLDLRRCGVL